MDLEQIRARLRERLADAFDAPSLTLSELDTPTHGGMSHETLLCRARWQQAGAEHERDLAIRVAPSGPHLFPDTDLALQCRILRALAADRQVPVPEVLFEDPDPDTLGQPYYVMNRIAGRVPSDAPPYQIRGWLHDATPEEQSNAQRHSLETLARIHRVSIDEFDFVARADLGSPGLDAEFAYWRQYLDWLADGEKLPVLEAAYRWCLEHRPDEPSSLTLNWGDARLGNLVFDASFEVAGVLDWEMATLGPAEMDLGWFLFLNETALIWLDDLPGFRPQDATLAIYSEALGRELRNLDFYRAWGGFRAAAIRARMVERDRLLGREPDLHQREDNPVVTSLRRLIELP